MKTEIGLPLYSGYILTFEPERTQWFAQRLYEGCEFSESFSALDWTFQARELVFLVLNKQPISISAITLMERMHGSGGSGKLKMRMSKTVVFDALLDVNKLSLEGIEDMICTPERLKRVGQDSWNAIINKVKQLQPSKADAVDALITLRTLDRRLLGDSTKVARLNEQRDALGISLEIAQLDRPSIIGNLHIERINEAQSILDLLDVVTVQERSLVEHDRRIFEMLLGDQSYHNAYFSGDPKRSVRAYVVDKDPLETVLGVDLIIYNACFDNYLLLQYKGMDKDKLGWSCTVDTQMQFQLERMSAFRSKSNTMSPTLPTLWTYRLNDDPFYFKFCERVRPSAREESLIRGITMSEMHVREFLALPEAKGIKGGLSIGYHNCPRYLNNTDFIQLASIGWIGAGKQATSLMRQVLEANIQGGRSAMLTVIDTPRQPSALIRTSRLRR